jgi:NhaP-type Na+/H+ or K+/H+ antiporter
LSEDLLLGLTAIVVLGVGVQWLAWRFRLPSILLLLLAGFLAGPIAGFIHPDEVLGELLFPLVSVSVAIILFEGGLTLRFSELPRLGGVIFRLISVGAMITWAIVAVSAHYIMELDWQLSVLLGAILLVTGPTVIGPLLRQIRPKGQSGAALKWEGILIDPVGAVLAVLIFEAIVRGDLAQATGAVLSGVLSTLLIGLGLGVVGAAAMIYLLSRYLIPDHLENGVTLLFVVLAFTASDWLHPESGLLTVTVMGVILANQNIVSIKHIEEFKENLQVLLLGVLFILLSARLEPRVIVELGARSLIFLAILIVIARPLSILLSTWRSDLNNKERLFMAWMAPRGIVAAAVSSIFSLELVEAGYAGAEQLVPLTFMTIIGTVSFYGLTAGPVARMLDLSEEDPQGVLIVGAHPFGRAIARVLQQNGIVAKLLDNNWSHIQASRMEELEAFYGNALSEDVFEDLNLTGVGRLLAMTSNNEVNSLAAVHFQEAFSRSEIYQLPMGPLAEENATTGNVVTQPTLTGRFLFGPEITFNYLVERFRQGAVVKATPLTPEFDYVDFLTTYEEEAVPLFVISNKNKLGIYTTDYQPIPKPGQILISLVQPIDRDELPDSQRDARPESMVES